MGALNDLNDAALRRAMGNMCLTKGVLAINAASAATVKTTNALTYTVGGTLCTKTALAAQSIAVTHDCCGRAVAAGFPAYVQPQNTTVHYVVALKADGTVAVCQGSYLGQSLTKTGDLNATDIGDGGVPMEPEGYTAIGVIKVATGAVTFTPGTTALDAASVTATYADVGLLASAY